MKIGASIFIILFLLVQSYFPISYYYRFYFKESSQQEQPIQQSTNIEPKTITFSELNLKQQDERFTWRMFSPTAIDTKCTFDFYSYKTYKKINYQSFYSKQWTDLMEMCRQPIIEEISKDLCQKNKNQQHLFLMYNKEILSNKFDARKQNRSNMLDKFIFEFKFNKFKIQLFKFIFYMMMAIDCWLEIPRSANYWLIPKIVGDGSGFVNQSHFPIYFDNFIKSILNINSIINDSSFLYSVIICGIISIRCAFSMNIQFIEPFILALLKGYLVFSSQSDNFQHHYLLVLVLILLSTINWNKVLDSKKKEQEGDGGTMVSCWQLKLLLIQLSIVYFWTSIAKLHWSWIDGSVLPRMVGPEFKELINQVFNPIIEMVPSWIGSTTIPINPMVILSCSTIIIELFLVFSLHIKKLSILTCLLGISMHATMGSSGLRIGTFSYFMIIFYILSLPDNLFNKLVSTTSKTASSSSSSTTSTTSSNIKSKLISTLAISLVCYFSMINIFKYIFAIHWWFLEYFEKSFIVVLVLMVIQNLFSGSSGGKNQIFKQISLFLSICLLVGLASNYRIEFRSTFIERGTISIKFQLFDESIENYLIAKEISDLQINSTSSNKLLSNDWLTGGILNEKNFEFIGDLGLFLESKNNNLKALEIYETYYNHFPNILKIHAGLIRTWSIQPLENNGKSKICNLIPNTIKLATQVSLNDKCFSQECNRGKGHANYLLDLIKKTKKNLNNCL